MKISRRSFARKTLVAAAIFVEGASAFDSLIESGRVSELTDPLSCIGGSINATLAGR